LTRATIASGWLVFSNPAKALSFITESLGKAN
jgi:hypothetical protein